MRRNPPPPQWAGTDGPPRAGYFVGGPEDGRVRWVGPQSNRVESWSTRRLCMVAYKRSGDVDMYGREEWVTVTDEEEDPTATEGSAEITPEWAALIDARFNRIAGARPAPHVERVVDHFEDKVNAVLTEAGALLISKHADYGPKNISLSPGGPLNGLRVRMWDKTARINNLIDSGAEPENESLRDSFIDLLNYSAIALLVLDGSWPE